jgi:hypothetical protein
MTRKGLVRVPRTAECWIQAAMAYPIDGRSSITVHLIIQGECSCSGRTYNSPETTSLVWILPLNTCRRHEPRDQNVFQ